MAKAKPAAKAKKSTTTRRKAAQLSPEKRAAHGEIQKGIANLGKSIAEIQRGLLKAEKEIELDARRRIAQLRKEGRAQLGALNAKRRDVAKSLRSASEAAGSSWDDVKTAAESILADAIGTAATYIGRIRDAITPRG